MAGRSTGIKRSSLSRSLSVSLAGARVGGAFAIDGILRKLKSTKDDVPSAFAKREAHRFVAELGRLKGTYVKIGQMLALLGEHFLPPVLTKALHELESQTEPLPWNSIKLDLQRSLGSKYPLLRIEKKSIAAASLAQVHRATVISTGEQICLKIQYPGLAEVIDADFDTVVRMLLLARWIKTGRELDEWLESMRVQLHHEIDYLREARMTQRVGELIVTGNKTNRTGGVRYHAPKLFPEFCSEKVLAMEYIDGYLVTRAEVSHLSQARRNALGKSMLELFFKELYEWGLLQTDPNFGNYLVRLDVPRKQQDELVLLDFGSILHCDRSFLTHFGNAVAAGQSGDRELLCESLIGLGCLHEDSSIQARESFSDFCLQLLEPLRPPEKLPKEYLNDNGEYCWGRSQLLRRVGKNAAKSAATRHFAIPSRDFAMIARKLTGVFTFIAVLNAQFNAHDIVQYYLAQWKKEE